MYIYDKLKYETEIAAVCPIHSVSYGGGVKYDSLATPEQIQAAKVVIANYQNTPRPIVKGIEERLNIIEEKLK